MIYVTNLFFVLCHKLVIYESDDDDEEESSTDDDEWGSTKPKTKRSTNRSKRLRQRNTGNVFLNIIMVDSTY